VEGDISLCAADNRNVIVIQHECSVTPPPLHVVEKLQLLLLRPRLNRQQPQRWNVTCWWSAFRSARQC